MIQVHEVKDKTVTLNVDGVLLSFMLKQWKHRLVPRMVGKAGYDGTRVSSEEFLKARKQAAAILYKERERSTETHPM